MLSVIFGSFVFFTQPFEFYFHYLIFLGLLPLLFLKYRLQRFTVLILLFTFLVGIVNVLLNGFVMFQFFKVWGGLTLSLTFYSLVIQYFKFDVMYFFKVFLKWSYYTCLIGVSQLFFYYLKFKPGYDYTWILNKWQFNEGGFLGARVNSIYSEPSTVAVIIAPAAYVALYNLMHKRKFVFNKIQSLIVLIIYVGSSSSTAFIGLFIILILVTDSIKLRYAFIGLFISGVAGFVLYNNVEEFKIRVDSSIGLWVHQEYTIENTNTSSFVLYNNVNVSLGSFAEHPIFGLGLGAYENAYEKHTLTKTVLDYDFEFNRTDGNSMFLRLMTETGLIGLFFVGAILYRGFIPKKESGSIGNRMISHSLLVMISLYLLRQGNYFVNGLPFFYIVYYYNWKEYYKNMTKTNVIEN